MRKRDVEHKEDERHTRRRLFRLRDDFLSKIRAHAGAGVFVEIVKFLNLDEAYALSKLDAEIELYFHKHGVWETYAESYLMRFFRTDIDTVVSYFHLPPDTRPNYLWIMVIFKQYQRHNTFKLRRGIYDVEVLILHPELLKIKFGKKFPVTQLEYMMSFWTSVGIGYRRDDDYGVPTMLFPIINAGDTVFQVLYSLMQLGFYFNIRPTDFYIRSKLKC